MAASLKEWQGEQVMVLTNDGRILCGTLVGNDQKQNLILQNTQERIYSCDSDVEYIDLGVYLVRGDSVAVVGTFEDPENHAQIRAPIPIAPIQQRFV